MTSDTQLEEPGPMPKNIGPYSVVSLLQRGGMSQLYLATDPKTRALVAVKILLPKFVSHPEVVSRFLKEAEILELVDHPNIVKMYGYGPWEGGYYIAMEFIVGISLRQFLLQHPFSLKRALEIILEVSYAVCHLHTYGIIHRDLKLENILITKSEVIKVIDFGIAQQLDLVSDEAAPHALRTIGTPVYMSPEQRDNPESVSYPSDIYSLGIITYELILGRLSHGHVHLVLMPKGLQKILTKALQPDPKDRYLDIVDFITDLNLYLNSESVASDRKIGDRTNELYEGFKRANKILMPEFLPGWPGLEVGVATDEIIPIQGGLYGDFFQFEDGTFALIFGDSEAVDAEKFIVSAQMRGAVRALFNSQISPQELAKQLNRMLVNDERSQDFFLCCLKLSPIKCKIQFISCGYGSLWSLDKGAELLRPLLAANSSLKAKGAGYKELVGFFEPDQELYIYGSLEPSLEMETLLVQGAVEYAGMPPQQKAEAILRKMRLLSPKQGLHHSVLAIIRYC